MSKEFWNKMGEVFCGITPGDETNFQAQWNDDKIKSDVDKLLNGIPDAHLKSYYLMDIGCGEGRLMTELAPRVLSYVGVDISEVVLNKAIHISNAFEYGNTQFYVLGDENFIIPDFVGKFGVIVSFTVFMHLPKSVFFKYLRQVYQYLNRGGYFHFHLNPSDCSDKFRFDAIPDDDRWSSRWYPDETIINELKKIGFSNIESPIDLVWKARKI